MPEYTQRYVDDPRDLRALAHPLRLELLEAVVLHGPLTATQAADLVGESPANCSWHLRQLAKHGFVEEAPGGKGRERPWQRTTVGLSWGGSDGGADYQLASQAVADVFFDREIGRVQAARHRRQPPEWVDATMSNQSLLWLTAKELADIDHQVRALFISHLDRHDDPGLRPPAARLVRLLAFGVPDDQSPMDSPDEEDAQPDA